MDPCGGVHPPVLVEVRHLHPLALPVDKVLIHKGPGLVVLLLVIKALDGEHLCLAAPAGVHGGGGALGVSRDEELDESVVEALLVAKEGPLLRTVEAEEFCVLVRDDAVQVGVLQQQADNNYQDADMEKIQYDQTEAGLVYQAQQLMVTYEQSRYNMENLQSARNLLKAQYEATVARQAAGMATQADVLSALKSVQDQDTAILSAQKSADNVHRSLCLMLGWAVDGQPEIRDVPEPDLNRIASMNPEADMETAISNNYDVKYYEKKAGNLTSQYLIESNQAQLQDARDKAAKSLRNQYNTVLTNRDSLNAAVMALDVAFVNLNTATAKRAVGEITELEYQSALNSYVSAKNSVETDKLQLLLAMEAYDWNVKGLTTSN